MSLIQIRKKLHQYADAQKAATFRIFFKNTKNDIFLGVPTKLMRQIAKEFHNISLRDVLILKKSNVHDERAIAHAILCIKFRKGNDKIKKTIFNFYIKNRHTIKDWGGVDDSAPYIVGVYLLNQKKDILYKLAVSKRIWDRRIAIVATWWFIRQNEMQHTIDIAKILLKDQEDLIQKATGWMLREVGKRNLAELNKFLKDHHQMMPRTTLRYAIEKLSLAARKRYLKRNQPLPA